MPAAECCPVIPNRDGFAGFLVHDETFALREGNSPYAIAPFGLGHHWSETISFVVQHSQDDHTLDKFSSATSCGARCNRLSEGTPAWTGWYCKLENKASCLL